MKRWKKKKSKKIKTIDVAELNKYCKAMRDYLKKTHKQPDILCVGGAKLSSIDEMGCDIHIMLQFNNPAIDADYWDTIHIGSTGRDYSLFGYIAGVRSSNDPVVEPRGKPDDIPEWEWDRLGADHTFTWLTPDEMQKAINLRMSDSGSVDMKLRYMNLLALRMVKDGYTARYVIGFDS